jgi:hypothetical protein
LIRLERSVPASPLSDCLHVGSQVSSWPFSPSCSLRRGQERTDQDPRLGLSLLARSLLLFCQLDRLVLASSCSLFCLPLSGFLPHPFSALDAYGCPQEGRPLSGEGKDRHHVACQAHASTSQSLRWSLLSHESSGDLQKRLRWPVILADLSHRQPEDTVGSAEYLSERGVPGH